MKKLNFWLLCYGLLSFTSCDIINPEEETPSFLYIPEITLKENPAITHGSLSQKITQINVFFLPEGAGATVPLGLYSLPATIPILLAGNTQVNIDPVIKANGSSLTLREYPFYERITFDQNLQPTVVDSLNLKTQYRSDAFFAFIEDFEDGKVDIFKRDLDLNDTTSLEAISEGAFFDGNYSGKIVIDKDFPIFAFSTEEPYSIDIETAREVYLELNYKTDIELEFGLIGLESNGDEVPNFNFVIRPSTSWNKIYLDLREEIQFSGFDRYRVMVRGFLPSENGTFTLDRAEVFFDNIKLVHFQ